MAGNNEIFQRIEKKYRLTPIQYKQFLNEMKPYMKVDQYGKSTICNVYYDTDQDELIRTSIEKPRYKEKLRLRSYGVPDEDGLSFIEIKKKYAGVVYKRRISLPLKEARNYLNHGIRPTTQVNPQILKEIDYFQQYYRTRPKMYIAYDRVATYGIEDSSIRITFDENIRYRQDDVDLAAGDAGFLLLKKGEALMEIKVGGAYPLWLVDILSKLKIYPVSYSKYGTAYKKTQAENNQNIKTRLTASA